MKKLALIIGVLTIAFAGCKEVDQPTTPDGNDNTDNNTGSKNGIVGVWNFEKLEQFNGSVKWDGVEISSYTSVSSNESGTVEFKEDNTYLSNTGYTSTTTTNLGQSQSVDIPAVPITGTYTYDETAKTLSTTNAGVETTANIEVLTADTLKYILEVKRVDEVNNITVESSNTTRMTFSR